MKVTKNNLSINILTNCYEYQFHELPYCIKKQNCQQNERKKYKTQQTSYNFQYNINTMQIRQSSYHQPYPINIKQYLQPTTIKSPSFQTISSFTQNYYLDLMNTSFQDDVAQDHVNTIWKASLQYLHKCVRNHFDQLKGFNDDSIFNHQFAFKDQPCNQLTLISLIYKNQLLPNNDKLKLLQGLKIEKGLKDLLQKLMKIFCEQIFQQLLLIICQLWQKYILFKQTTKLCQQLQKFLAPSTTQIDINNLPQKMQNYYIHQSQSKITQIADQAAQQISGCYFINTKLKYLNLRQANTINNRTNYIRNQFHQFIQVIARAIFLCADGCFCHPNTKKVNQQLNQKCGFSMQLNQLCQPNFDIGRKRKNY